jgi:hypothetical protein
MNAPLVSCPFPVITFGWVQQQTEYVITDFRNIFCKQFAKQLSIRSVWVPLGGVGKVSGGNLTPKPSWWGAHYGPGLHKM